jgi:hypothetical protein
VQIFPLAEKRHPTRSLSDLRRMAHDEAAGKRAVRPRCEAAPFCRRGTKLMSEKRPQASFSH